MYPISARGPSENVVNGYSIWAHKWVQHLGSQMGTVFGLTKLEVEQ